MELLILPDQFIIKYSPAWMVILLLSGLILFFVSKRWRKHFRRLQKHSFMPGVLFTISFIFMVGGINFYVYKVVMNKDGIILFNIKQFNEQINWGDMERVEYQDNQKILFVLNNNVQDESIVLNLKELNKNSMNKVRILIDLKLKQSKNSATHL